MINKIDVEYIMPKIELCNGKVIIKNKMLLSEIIELLDSYGFKITNREEIIIYHGELVLEGDTKIVVHLYFESATKVIQRAVIHIFPIDFGKVQKYLVDHYGEPTVKRIDSKFIWTFPDGEMIHSIIDRFGEEEGIYYLFK